MTNGIGRVGWRNYVAPGPTGNPLWNTLSNYYSFDNTPNDSKGTANGTLVNGATYSTGKINNGLLTDGINDTFKTTSSGYTGGSFTINVWWMASSFPPLSPIVRTATRPSIGELVIYYTSGQLRIFQGQNGSYTYINNPTFNPVLNTWYMLTLTYNYTTTQWTISINGTFNSSGTLNSSLRFQDLSNGFLLGELAGYYNNGKNDELSLFNSVLTSTQITELYNGGAGKQYVAPTPAYTTRTAAFATATGITDTTILNALNTFDTGLISNGLDTKMKALYPFVGGTANTHKFNFMDARDLDVAFRLQFNGGWTHSSTGARPNGSNGYANTFLSPYLNLNVNSRHLSMYASDNSQANQYSIDMGAYDSSGSKSNHLSIHRDADNVVGQLNNWGNQSLVSSNNQTGLLLINRSSNVSSKAWKRNVLIASTTNDITGQVMPNFPIFIGNSNDNGNAGSVASSRGFSIASIGSGLSDTEASTFYTLVQAMQTTLGRAV